MKEFFGKLLFPNIHPMLRREKMRTLTIGLSVGLVVSLIILVTAWLLTRSSGSSSNSGTDIMPFQGIPGR